MRAMLLANELIKDGHRVTLISSSFFHQRKSFRSKKSKIIKVKKNLKIILINSSGYKKNISLRRIYDHINLAFNLHKFLKKNKNFRPDKIFVGYPPIETSYVIINWAKRNNIPVMLDVKDNWPENFLEPFPQYLKKIARFFLLPYYVLAKYIFINSNNISSITESFIKWIKNFSNSEHFGENKSLKTKYLVAPLVREKIIINKKKFLESQDFWIKKGIKIKERKHFSFVGSLSNAFDFEFIYKIARLLTSSNPDYIFVICGIGDKYTQLKLKFRDLKNVYFIGEVDKYKALLLIRNSIATLAPYQNNSNFQNSIPNKVIESLENGIPFITNTKGELKKLIAQHNNGIFLEDNYKDLYKLKRMINDEEFLRVIRKNAKKSYEDLFDFKKTYQKIIFKLTQV